MTKHNSEKGFLYRTDIYDLVWSKPLTSLTKELEISDSGLRKICKKYDIPIPRCGHWMKLKYEKSSPITPLPARDNIKISLVDNAESKESSLNLGYHLTKRNIANDTSLSLEVLNKLIKPDPIIKNARKIVAERLNSRKKTYRKRESENIEYYIPEVSKELLTRAYCILDTIFKALRKRGHKLDFYQAKSH